MSTYENAMTMYISQQTNSTCTCHPSEEAEQLLDQLNQLISSGEIQGREDLIDEILGGIEKRSTDTLKILGILKKNEVNVEKLQIKANEIRNQYLVLKKDRHNILLQTKDASLKGIFRVPIVWM